MTEILLFALIPRYIAKMSQGQWRYDFVLVQLQSCIGLQDILGESLKFGY